MTIDEAATLIAHSAIDGTAWADLGAGEGTFTLALATLLPAGSVIHAIDRDRTALRRIPPRHAGVQILTHAVDFATTPLPVAGLDGILLANALHFVADPLTFIHDCESALARRRFLIVEYDTDTRNDWVPYPVSKKSLMRLFNAAGYPRVTFIGERQSIYRRAAIYSALVEAGAGLTPARGTVLP